MIFPRGWVLLRFAFCPCHAFHIMSSRALHLHTYSSHAFEYFSRCPFCIPALRSPPVAISSFLSCVVFKHFRIGPSLVMRPWFTTGRPPVKFRVIWTSFGTPTVNRGSRKASFVCSPTPLQSGPKPTKLCSMLSVVRSRSCGRKPHSIWSLLAPPTYKSSPLPKFADQLHP